MRFRLHHGFFKPDNPALFTDAGFFIGARTQGPYKRRGGGLIRMEDGRLLATITGRMGEYPPRKLDEFMDYAKTLLEPSFYEIISKATAVTEPHHFKFPQGIRRHFERLQDFPEGLLPVGDAVCHYNPVCGQGMSAACREAVGLGEVIGELASRQGNLEGVWKTYFPRVFEETRAPWLFACLADIVQQGCEGDFPTEEQPAIERMMKLRELAMAGELDAQLALGSVGSLRKSLGSFFTADIDKLIGPSE